MHELIGSRFWDEEILPHVTRARTRHLRRGGRLLPFQLDVLLAPTRYVSELERALAFWTKKREGFDLGAFGRRAFAQTAREALLPTNIALRDTASLLAPPKVIFRADLRRTEGLPAEIKTSFRLRRGQRLAGLCAFLRVHLDPRRSFSTGSRAARNALGPALPACFRAHVVAKDTRLDVTLSMATRASDGAGAWTSSDQARRGTRAPRLLRGSGRGARPGRSEAGRRRRARRSRPRARARSPSPLRGRWCGRSGTRPRDAPRARLAASELRQPGREALVRDAAADQDHGQRGIARARPLQDHVAGLAGRATAPPSRAPSAPATGSGAAAPSSRELQRRGQREERDRGQGHPARRARRARRPARRPRARRRSTTAGRPARRGRRRR